MADMNYLLAQPDKIYVTVLVQYDKDGMILPCQILLEDRYKGDRWIPIDSVSGPIPRASRKAGGAGQMFTIHFGRHTRHLFLEGDSPEDARYFIERGEPE